MKKTILAAVFACFMVALCGLSASAQSPIHWKADVTMVSETEGVVTLTATADEGWHFYGTVMPEDGPNPTKLFYGGTGVKFLGNVKVKPAPVKEMDPVYEAELSYWDKTATFTRRFEVTDPSEAKVLVSVSYMCCNESMCRPPVTEKFTLRVK